MTWLPVLGRGTRTGMSRPSGAGTVAVVMVLALLTACSNTPLPAAPIAAPTTSTAAPATAPATSAAPATTGATTGAPSTSAATVVVIKSFRFMPDAPTVPAGATVMVDNQDGANHTVTANDGSFDTGNVPGNAKGMFTAPSKPGTYPYKCAIHPFMTGTLTVT